MVLGQCGRSGHQCLPGGNCSSKTAASLTKKERDAIVGTYVVQIGTTGTNSTGESGYQVYLKSSELTAYGYMTRDANTCINSTYKRQDGTWGYVGGYDLMISELTQVREGKVVGQTESTIKTITAPLSIRSSRNFAKRLLELNKQTTTTHKTGEGATAYGENTSGRTSTVPIRRRRAKRSKESGYRQRPLHHLYRSAEEDLLRLRQQGAR